MVSERIIVIDILRGFAVLGIFVMNSMSFAFPEMAYMNPNAFGGDDLLNHCVYAVLHVFADQKFMSLFSILFGASVIILTQNLQQKGQKVARFYYTRNVWLAIFGLLHMVFIWHGDVLFVYALCSLVLFFFKKMPQGGQLVLGLVIFYLFPAVASFIGGVVVSNMPENEIAALEAVFHPSQAEIIREITYYSDIRLFQSGYDYDYNEDSIAFGILGIAMLIDAFCRSFGMMLIGMAIYKMGILTGERSDYFYKRMLIGLPIGFSLVILGLVLKYWVEWDAVKSMFFCSLFNLFATPFIVSGYIALIVIWSRSKMKKSIQQGLASIGRMALTNYIGQSLIGASIFYGYGLGLYGSINRIQLLLIVMLVWLCQFWFSVFWLRYFRYGPLEWVWRSLSYWRIQRILY